MSAPSERRLRDTIYDKFFELAGEVQSGKITREEFAHELTQQQIENFKDSLTGLYNRKFFDEEIGLLIHRAERQEKPLSIVLVDLDNLKIINDKWGHLAGDKVLEVIGGTIKKNVRLSDVAARYGGDELAVLLPNADEDEAKKIAERLLKAVQVKKVDMGKEKIKFTISIGVASLKKGMTAKELIDKADKALYQAKNKRKGRW